MAAAAQDGDQRVHERRRHAAGQQQVGREASLTQRHQRFLQQRTAQQKHHRQGEYQAQITKQVVQGVGGGFGHRRIVDVSRPQRHGEHHDIHGEKDAQAQSRQRPAGAGAFITGADQRRREATSEATELGLLRIGIGPATRRQRQPAVFADRHPFSRLAHDR